MKKNEEEIMDESKGGWMEGKKERKEATVNNMQDKKAKQCKK